jgi:hypothetical protein
MAQINNQGISSETPSAPLERGIGQDFIYTHIIHLHLGGARSFDGPVEDLIQHRLEGCGKVDLVSMSIKAVAKTAGAFINIGTSAVGSSSTALSLGLTPSGFVHVANALNVGVQIEQTLIPMSNVSRQIRPASTNLPMLRLVFEKSENIQVNLVLYIKVEGVIVHHDSIDTMSNNEDD